jgi:hypothetical protein
VGLVRASSILSRLVSQRLSLSRPREKRSQLTTAKFRVLTGSLKSLLQRLGQGLLGQIIFEVATQSMRATQQKGNEWAVQKHEVERDWVVRCKGVSYSHGMMLAASHPWRTLPGKPDDVTLVDLTGTIACGVLHRKTGVGVRRVRSPDADRVEDRMFTSAKCMGESALFLGFGVVSRHSLKVVRPLTRGDRS